MIVLATSALIELLTDARDLRQVVATRLLAEEAAGEQPLLSALAVTSRMRPSLVSPGR
ncbi:MAG: hypothetical protein ACT4NY_04930 [Pseudonocardiales bacterium]